jgi:hypothetical protein
MPAAAAAVQLLFAIADQRFEVAGCEPRQRRLVPGEVGLGVALGAGIVRHAAARDHSGAQTERRHHPRHRLAERVAAFNRRLRRQIGVDRDRQYRVLDAQMSQWDAHRVVDLSRAGEGRVEPLAIKPLDDLKADFARHLPVEIAAGEMAAGAGADMYREGRRDVVEELLCVVV